MRADVPGWEAALSEVQAELLPGLRPWAEGLEGVLGALRVRDARREGEPNGYEGLSRRGPYDRLLLSEWGLLDAAPDEFVRRAAQAELGFYAIEQRRPTVGARIRVVLDAGPSLWGAPRLAQLVLLLVMARRAALAGAELVWSVSSTPLVFWVGVKPGSAMGLMRARSTTAFVVPDLSAEPESDERWLVTGEDLTARGWDVVRLTEPMVGPRVIGVRVQRGEHVRYLTLPMLDEGLRQRLWAGPFAPAAPPPPVVPKPARPTPDAAAPLWRPFHHQMATPVGLRFVPNTEQLLVRFADGAGLLWSLANLPKRSVPKPKYISPSAVYGGLGVGFCGSRLLTMQTRSGSVVCSGVIPRVIPLDGASPPGGDGEVYAVGSVLWLLDSTGTMWVSRTANELVPLPGKVCEVAADGHGFRVLVQTPAGCGFIPLSPVVESGKLGWAAPQVFTGVTDARWGVIGCLGRFGSGWVRGRLTGEHERIAAPTGDAELLGERSVWDDVRHAHALAQVWWSPSEQRVLGGDAAITLPRRPLKLAMRGDLLGIVTAHSVEVWSLLTGQPLMLRGSAA